MGLMSWAGRVAAGALAAAALATVSRAATYVFLVHVTEASSSVGGPAFRPVSFLQTWTLDPQASSTSVEGPASSLRFERANGPATWTPSPFDPLVGSVSGLTLPDAGFSALKSGSSGFGAPSRSSYDIDFAATARKTTDSGPVHIVRTSSFSMSAMGTPPNNFDPLDQYGVRDLLRYTGALSWRLEGKEQAFQGETFLFANRVAYSGFARLVGFEPTPVIVPPPSAVPEPAAWALLLSGFGLAGARLRRRRGAVRPAQIRAALHLALETLPTGVMSWGGRMAAGALVAAALATASQAATYTFRVRVLDNIFDPASRPVDFLQTWTLEPSPLSVAFSVGGLTVHSESAFAQATFTPSPFDAAIQDLTGLTLSDAGLGATKYRNSADGGSPVDGFKVEFSGAQSETRNFAGFRFQRDSNLSIVTFGDPPNNFDRLDALGLRDLLLYAGPMLWRQEGRAQTFANGVLVSDKDILHIGFATLVGFEPTPPITPPSAVPEPASWALLLCGFGLAGAHLRRRPALAS